MSKFIRSGNTFFSVKFHVSPSELKINQNKNAYTAIKNKPPPSKTHTSTGSTSLPLAHSSAEHAGVSDKVSGYRSS